MGSHDPWLYVFSNTSLPTIPPTILDGECHGMACAVSCTWCVSCTPVIPALLSGAHNHCGHFQTVGVTLSLWLFPGCSNYMLDCSNYCWITSLRAASSYSLPLVLLPPSLLLLLAFIAPFPTPYAEPAQDAACRVAWLLHPATATQVNHREQC